MTDRLTDSVARLYRAGSEDSKQTEKLRDAIKRVLSFIEASNLIGEMLPFGCKLYSSGEFTQERDGAIVFCLSEGRIGLGELLLFSKLIADGFLDKLSELLEKRAETFSQTTARIDVLVTPPSKSVG